MYQGRSTIGAHLENRDAIYNGQQKSEGFMGTTSYWDMSINFMVLAQTVPGKMVLLNGWERIEIEEIE
jgi:hypothetical protein